MSICHKGFFIASIPFFRTVFIELPNFQNQKYKRVEPICIVFVSFP